MTDTGSAARPRIRTAGDDMKSWPESTACQETDPELFFPIGPSRQSAGQIGLAKSLCRRCPAVESCRGWALDHPRLAEYGVWGGLTEGERRAISRTAIRGRRDHR
ncbi:WhiB family redox-sensing transcriptional regulator [Catenulispora sp. EB89]